MGIYKWSCEIYKEKSPRLTPKDRRRVSLPPHQNRNAWPNNLGEASGKSRYSCGSPLRSIMSEKARSLRSRQRQGSRCGDAGNSMALCGHISIHRGAWDANRTSKRKEIIFAAEQLVIFIENMQGRCQAYRPVRKAEPPVALDRHNDGQET